MDHRGIVFSDGTGIFWPFARLRYRLRTGRWCAHEGHWSNWWLIDEQRRRMRRCTECDHAEIQ